MNWEFGKPASIFVYARVKTSIFFSIRDLRLLNFPDMELILKCPIINLLTFFILSWLKSEIASQGPLWPIEIFPVLLLLLVLSCNLFETFEAYFEVFMLLLNSEPRWIHSNGLYKIEIIQIRNKVVC